MANKVIISILVLLVVLMGGVGYYSYTLNQQIDRLDERLVAFEEEELQRYEALNDELADLRKETDPMASLLAAITRHDVTDAVVRVIVQLGAEQEGLIRDTEIRKALEGAYYVASVSREVERDYRQRLGGESPEGLTPAELLTRYLESKDTPPERLQVLLQQAEEIFQEDL